MRHLVFLCLFLTFGLSSGTALADRAGLQSEFEAYQTEAARGNNHAALPHIEQAYTYSREIYGSDHRNTGLLAYHYGHMLAATLRYYEAKTVLAECIEILRRAGEAENAAEIFDATIELAQVQYQLPNFAEADRLLSEAATLAGATFGPSSPELGLVHYHQAYSIFQQLPIQDEWHSRVRPWEREGGDYLISSEMSDEEFIRLCGEFESHIRQAMSLIPENHSDRWKVLALRGRYHSGRAETRDALRDLERAIELGRTDLEVSDDLILAYSAYIFSRQARGRLSARELERMVLDAYELATHRVDGQMIPILQLNLRGQGYDPFSSAEIEFDVLADGRVDNVRVRDSNASETFVEDAVLAVSGYVYAPLTIAGHTLPVPGQVTYLLYTY